MSCSPLFSLIVPTINRTDELAILLRSLCQQTVKDFEVLIVDQNKDARVQKVVHAFSDKLLINHIVRPLRGASRARNEGLRLARGKIISFPDDDCEYPHDLLEKISFAFAYHKDVGGITCYTRDKTLNHSVVRMASKEQAINKYNILVTLVEFTIFFKRHSAKDLYFDEDMGPGAPTPWQCDEGPDLVLRMIKQGVRFIYKPDIIIYHPNPVKNYDEKAIIRSYKYGNGRGRFLRKHSYPKWFVFYIWGLYLAGIALGCMQFHRGKIRYYWSGLRGRIKGYVQSK